MSGRRGCREGWAVFVKVCARDLADPKSERFGGDVRGGRRPCLKKTSVEVGWTACHPLASERAQTAMARSGALEHLSAVADCFARTQDLSNFENRALATKKGFKNIQSHHYEYICGLILALKEC